MRLRAVLVPALGEPRGSVVLSPGRTEPIEKYFEVMGELAGRGFVVLAHDWRGQGLSQRLLPDRMKGHAQGYQDYLADHAALLDAFAARLPRPWLTVSHSMGGCLTLLALVRGERRLSGAVLSAPMLQVFTGATPAVVAQWIAWTLSRVGLAAGYALPVYDPFADRFQLEALTHDRSRYARFKAQLRASPDLALGALTWGWLDCAFSMERAVMAPGGLERVQVPVTMVAAEKDRLVINDALRSAAGRLPHGRYLEIPGAFHEILMESDEIREQFWRAFDQLAADCAPGAGRALGD